jgi:hypothetical protein
MTHMVPWDDGRDGVRDKREGRLLGSQPCMIAHTAGEQTKPRPSRNYPAFPNHRHRSYRRSILISAPSSS